jgi:hypothetical protein
MNARGRSAALEYRRMAAAEQYRKEAERARETAKQGKSDRAFWLALAVNWEKLAKMAEAPIKPWAT